MTRDQELVEELHRRLPSWNPDEICKSHQVMGQSCRYDKQGRLIVLHLCGLRLSEVPPEIWQFPALQYLYLSYNLLSTLPAEMGNLSALENLHLDTNCLRTLPAEIGKLFALRELYLVHNFLETLPAEIGKLSALEVLYLSGNQLSTLPAEIGKLSALQQLYLAHNRLSTLPVELGNLSKLFHLELSDKLLYPQLSDNPLQTPPPEIVAQGTSAILAYLRTLQQAPVERFEAKVILVGEGGMGKSSLLRALRGQPFTPDLPATHGIEVGALLAPHPTRTGQQITLYTWDFGGQEIFQATHQFFLTQRSLYLLLWDARRGAEHCRVSFWLETITAHAPDATVLLVATHIDTDLTSTPYFPLASYQQRHPQLVGLCAISNKTGAGLEALKAQIVAAAMQTPFVGQQWPRAWVEAEEALLARPEHHLDRADFLLACRQHQIEDETERETFGRYLHDLGKLLYFHDDPVLRTLVVLKPNWITKAISRVLEDPQVRQAGGVLDYRELPRIWATDEQGRAYPSALYPIFVRMMERFALCYQLEPERPGQPARESLIPQLLPDQPPVLPPVPTAPAAGQVRLEMRYTLSFVPAGLISWLLVRTHRYSLRQHWREGARLAYAGQQAHLELDSRQREITITVWGPFPYTFLLILKHTLDDLLQTFQGLRVQRSIPCRCARQQQAPHAHSYEDLERRLARGESKIICQEGAHLPLATLLYGLHASTVPQVVATVQKTQQAITRQLAPVQQAQQSQVSAQEMQRMLARLDQGQELLYRTMLQLDQQRKKLEQEKLSHPCPGLFVLERASRKPLNPHDWVSRAYRLRLLCLYPQGPHLMPGEEGYELRQGKEWWNAMRPWLRSIVKLLEIGLPLGEAVNKVVKLVDIERFAPQIEIFKEILADLPEIEASDALKDARLDGQAQTLQRLEGAALEALHTFLSGYPRPWQGLTRVIADDGTLWWVCDQHRKEFEAGLITVR